MKSISLYRVNGVLLLVILATIILYYGKAFLIPLTFGILLAMLLLPVCRKLEKWGVSRVWATLLGILCIILLVLALAGVITAQIISISENLPQMQTKAQALIESVQTWIQGKFGVSPQKQISYLQKGIKNIGSSANTFFTSFLSGAVGLITGFVLVLLYVFFLLWKREKYQEFFLKLVQSDNREEVHKELGQITHVASQYLIGRLISMGFLAAFYMIGFSVAGLQNGALVGLIAVVPTIVPYIGSILGAFFPLAMALVSGSTDSILPVVIILAVAQVIDNNIIEPFVEGESLDISPIFTIVAIVLGELVWGVAGMILFIPLFAVLKIICDHIPRLHPYAFLLQNEMEEPAWAEKLKGWFKRDKE